METLEVCDRELGRHRISSPSEASQRTLVSCGRIAPKSEVVIVDPQTFQKCDEDQIGEIWLRGPHVSLGYWEKPEVNAEIFGAMTRDGEGPYLRTGDYGFIRDGDVYVTGRLKDLIIIRGRNIYPQDIEYTSSAAHPKVDGGAAVALSVRDGDDEGVAVIQELSRSSRDTEDTEVKSAIREAVMTTHQVRVRDVVLVPFMSIPKTTSGKVRRAASRKMLSGEVMA